jgi:peptidoglycan/LPS O-acetylase OafA/YrhL
VDMFFVLSGLVIVQSLKRYGGQARPFLIARVARIFPVFLPVFAFSIAVQALSCSFDHMPWIAPDSMARDICASLWPQAWLPELLAHLTMTHGLFPQGVLPNAWVSFLGSAWSLSTEWQFYALAALVAINRHRLLRALLVLALAGLAWHWLTPEAWQFSRAFLPNKAHFFALGVASEALVRRRPGAVRPYIAVLAMTLAVCATQQALGKLLPPLAWTLCLAVQMYPVAPGLSLANRLLESRVMQYFGAISYCVYLVNEPMHKVIGYAVSRMVDRDGLLFTFLWVPLTILLPIGVAAGLHAWVEVPALRWGHTMAQVRVVHWLRGMVSRSAS